MQVLKIMQNHDGNGNEATGTPSQRNSLENEALPHRIDHSSQSQTDHYKPLHVKPSAAMMRGKHKSRPR